MPRILVDAMGGDNAPAEVVAGAAQASLAGGELDILLVGDLNVIGDALQRVRHDASRIRLCHVPMQERASSSPRWTPTVGAIAEMVAEGDGDAVVSAGDRHGWLAACAEKWTLLPNLTKPATAAVFPTELRRGRNQDPFALLLDVDARADATAAELVQFAKLGATYAAIISRNSTPRVALLAASNQPPLGPAAVAAADAVLKTQRQFAYVGAIEGMQIPRGIADVIVAPGQLGNVVLSMLESAGDTLIHMAEYARRSTLTSRLATMALTTAVQSLRPFTEWAQYAGAPVLGYRDLLLRVHPLAKAPAFANAIRLAAIATSRDLLGGLVATTSAP